MFLFLVTALNEALLVAVRPGYVEISSQFVFICLRSNKPFTSVMAGPDHHEYQLNAQK